MTKEIELSPIILDNRAFLFSPDSSLLVIGDGSFADSSPIWDVKTRQIIGTIPQGGEPVAFSPDSRILATKKGFEVSLWDVSTPTEPLSMGDIDLTNHKNVCIFSPDGTILLDATELVYDWYSHAEINLWDVDTGDKLLTLYGHTEPINTLAFSPDGQTLASGSDDGTVLLWDWDEVINDVILENRLTNDR